MKGAAVRLGRDMEEATEVKAQSGRRAEATAQGNALNGFVSGFQQALGERDALLEKPVIGAGAERGAEAAGEGARLGGAEQKALPGDAQLRAFHGKYFCGYT
jgi:hypothetical protein